MLDGYAVWGERLAGYRQKDTWVVRWTDGWSKENHGQMDTQLNRLDWWKDWILHRWGKGFLSVQEVTKGQRGDTGPALAPKEERGLQSTPNLWVSRNSEDHLGHVL